MTAKVSHAISHFEIARLANLNWQKDGCPSGRDLDYWLEAESYLKATWHLGASETKLLLNGQTGSATSRPKAARKTSARRELAQHF